jgi:hypothetical protein
VRVLGIIALSALAFGVTFRSTVGCSDDTVVNSDAAPPSDASDGGTRSDSSLDDAARGGDATEGGDGPILLGDAGAMRWDGRAPQAHREAGVACPPERVQDAGDPCFALTPQPGNPCVTSADCADGSNGHCFCTPAYVPPEDGAPNTLNGKTFCSYDQCFADTDCPPRVPCGCGDPLIPGTPNACMSASHCAVDSDCPSPGFCSPSGPGYFCHTPNDTCIDSADCPPAATPQVVSACVFDADAGVWGCVAYPERL